MKNIVVAYDLNKAIGKDGGLPWDGQLPADTERFRAITMGGTVIMGSRTWDSIPERFLPLAGRQNIVLSLARKATDQFEIARSLEIAYEMSWGEEVFVIGGGEVYKEAIDTVDRLLVTEIRTKVENPDTFFPTFTPKEFNLTHDVYHPPEGANNFGYSFQTYLRNYPISSIVS